MLHAVKYLLIAMQFPQVHKKNFMMMMLNFVCLTRLRMLLLLMLKQTQRHELNYQTDRMF